jgi:PIN domain nuclease of toxin-antitoxin system
MRLLLDTHAFLWFVLGDPLLSARARSLIEDPANATFISPASYWEMAIKISIGRYVLHEPYEDFFHRGIEANGFQILHIEPRHTAALTTLPFHHRDPFDRLLIAHALVEQMAIVSADTVFDSYPFNRLW